MKALNVALIGYKFMGKAHSSALLECPFFFKNGVQPVRKVIVGRHEAPLQQAAADFGCTPTTRSPRTTSSVRPRFSGWG